MEITCPNCQTKYNLDESRISPEGSPVRCTRCRHLFTAHRSAAEPPPEALAETPPEAPPETTSEAPPEVRPEVSPEVPPQASTEAPPEEALEAAPEVPPEVPFEIPPEAPPETTPEGPPEEPPPGPPEAPPQPALFEPPFPPPSDVAEAPSPESSPPLPERDQDTEPEVAFEPPPEAPAKLPIREKRRGGFGGFLLWSLVWLILLAGAAYGALIFVHQTKLFPKYVRLVRDNPTVQRTIGLIQRVPYLNYPFVDHGLEAALKRLLKGRVEAVPWLTRSLEPRPAKKAPPRIKARSDLTIVVAQGRFVTDARAGRLFVVEGKIRNIGQSPVSFIRLWGVLYVRDPRQQNVVFGKPVLAYAGVIFNAAQFKRLPLKAIQERLKDRFGDDRSNYLVQPGHDLGFMVVFDKLPLKRRLSEYEVKIHSSVAGTPPETGRPGPAR
jgi:predicted Zn finger-like uncharacterized protein